MRGMTAMILHCYFTDDYFNETYNYFLGLFHVICGIASLHITAFLTLLLHPEIKTTT